MRIPKLEQAAFAPHLDKATSTHSSTMRCLELSRVMQELRTSLLQGDAMPFVQYRTN